MYSSHLLGSFPVRTASSFLTLLFSVFYIFLKWRLPVCQSNASRLRAGTPREPYPEPAEVRPGMAPTPGDPGSPPGPCCSACTPAKARRSGRDAKAPATRPHPPTPAPATRTPLQGLPSLVAQEQAVLLRAPPPPTLDHSGGSAAGPCQAELARSQCDEG